MKGQKPFEIVASFDTETCNYTMPDGSHVAWCILYIFEDLRGVGIRRYTEGAGAMSYLRTDARAIAYLEDIIAWGRERRVVPVVCAYNLMFDLQTLMYELSKQFYIRVTAQSATNVYVLDLMADETSRWPLLRFWDTFHLDMRGLSAMGETAGVSKLTGDWDYNLIRTPDTPLTAKELDYAAHDVHIIPAYLRYLLEANAWLSFHDLAQKVMTKTSIVRTFSEREIGKLKFKNSKDKDETLYSAFLRLCASQFWSDFDEYALQRACFMGGLTFTAANFASRAVRRVWSLDETSAHHAFINGRMIPVDFKSCPAHVLQAACESIVSTPLDSVLARYDCPWMYGIHAHIKFTNIRLREGSAFEAWGIAITPQGKYAIKRAKRIRDTVPDSPRNDAADEVIAQEGYVNTAENPTFAFSKLMRADTASVYVSEVELWAMSRVYAWDEMQALDGEVSCSWQVPPDYVTLQSNVLFAQKQAMKRLLATYHEGEPYTMDIDERIPAAIREECKAGTADIQFLTSYYNSTVKGMFNGIYGVQAQNVLRPDYTCREGDLAVDAETKVTRDNFYERQPKKKKVLYTYGLRIVGGSRLQLVLAIELLHTALGSRVTVVGGDTDSVKVACASDVGEQDLLDALAPLHKAIRDAIARTQRRVRECFPAYVSDLKNIGEFEIENETPYEWHMELWNKARVSWDGTRAHVTCAGLSRPKVDSEGNPAYHIEHAIAELIGRGISFEEAVNECLGYNTLIANSISHALERTRPKAKDRVRTHVTDYTGDSYDIDLPSAIALYASVRNIADTTKRSNICNVKYLASIGNDVDVSEKMISYDKEEKRLHAERMTPDGWEEL